MQRSPARSGEGGIGSTGTFSCLLDCQTTIAFSSGLMPFGEGISLGGTLVTASGWNSHALLVRKILSNQNTQSVLNYRQPWRMEWTRIVSRVRPTASKEP